MSKIDPYQLVAQLSADNFVSGEMLASLFEVSRAAVAKHIKQLNDAGLEIFSVNRRGYKLKNTVNLYNKESLQTWMHNPSDSLIDVLFITDSTNDYVKEKASRCADGYVCIAEAQKQGKGRQGKNWFSPFGANIYLSMKWGFPLGFQSLSGLSLAVGVSVLRVVQGLVSPAVTLKWPNDIYVGGEKAAGVLIEVSGNPDGSCDAIIGVGLNLKMPENNMIDQPWTDLASNADQSIDKNKLVADLINQLRFSLNEFAASGLSSFIKEWEAHDHFKGQAITLLLGKSQLNGIARGIASSGALLVDVEENGEVIRKEFFGGEISVRPI